MIDAYTESLKPAALNRLAKIVGDAFNGGEITELFAKAECPDIVHDGSTKWRFVYAALQDLQKRKLGQHAIFRFIEVVCDPQEYLGREQVYQPIVNEINNMLAYYSVKVDEDGTVVKTSMKPKTAHAKHGAELFDSRRYHEQVIRHAKQKFSQENYFDAVDECCKAFEKYVKEKSDLAMHGSKLMGSALSAAGPLRLNPNNTATEKSQQDGLMHLCMGLMMGIRNPIEHEPQLDFEMDRHDALDILSFTSYLFRQIDKCSMKNTQV